MRTLMLIDGNSLLYRAFFAIPSDMATASGQVTNATYGFTSMLINLMRDHQPDLLAVAFDRPEPTFRHELVDTYKAGRAETPDILRQQFGIVRQLIETLNIPMIEAVGFEADDIIATLATRAAAEDISSIIVTGDRDSYQLVADPHIRVLYNKRGVSDYALYDEAGIFERTGVRPDQYVWYAAMRGDPSDNLPGIAGVGEKTAAKLIASYGDLDGVFAHLDEQTPKLRENLATHEAQARSNAEMMRLVRDVPLGVDPEDLVTKPFDQAAVAELFKFLEFNSMLGRLNEAFGVASGGIELPQREVVEAEVAELDAAGAADLFSTLATRSESIAVGAGWSGTPGRSALRGLAVVVDRDAAEVSWIPADVLDAVREPLEAFIAAGPPWISHDAKPILRSLLGLGLGVPELSTDTKIAAYLLDPADSRYSVGDLLGRYCDRELAASSAADTGQLDFGGAAESESAQPAREALGVAFIAEPIAEALAAQHLDRLAIEIEYPLISVLARMEHVGVAVDSDELRSLNQRLTAECDRLRAAIIEDAGEEFNVNSTPQLRTILFDKLGLATQKKTKTGYSTDAASLAKLAGQHPIIDHLRAYREVEKLRSTYGEGLLAEVGADGRIHATFNQTVARTGRLSSDAPNLHNIPVRSEEGRQFRRVFVPTEGMTFLIADYNQIELRCIAHLAEDPGLIEAFTSGHDIHNETAARVFGVDAGSVTVEQRSKAKMVSYGLAYGMEAYGLAQRLAIGTKEAQVILDAYFDAFPAVKDYMDRTIAEARERGYTETLFGRRRRIPELASGVRTIRMAGERQAMNAGIQGLAADIFKVALVRLDSALEARGRDAQVILQVHDEVICEVPPALLDEVRSVVVDVMTHAFEMNVPLEVNLSSGDTWAAAKG